MPRSAVTACGQQSGPFTVLLGRWQAGQTHRHPASFLHQLTQEGGSDPNRAAERVKRPHPGRRLTSQRALARDEQAEARPGGGSPCAQPVCRAEGRPFRRRGPFIAAPNRDGPVFVPHRTLLSLMLLGWKRPDIKGQMPIRGISVPLSISAAASPPPSRTRLKVTLDAEDNSAGVSHQWLERDHRRLKAAVGLTPESLLSQQARI